MIKRLIIFFIFVVNLFAISTEKLAKISANSLYNLDNDQIAVTIVPFLKDDNTITAIKIIDNTDNTVFFQIYKKGNKLITSKIPSNILKFKKEEKNIIYDDEVIGKIIVYRQNNSFLTDEEKKWIKNNIVTIGVEQWKPIVFSNNGHDIDGISGDFTKLIIKKTGLKVKIINNEWDFLLKQFKKHNIDILPATFYTKKRSIYGLYSKPYFQMKNFLYVREDSKIKSFKDLKTLAIVKGYGTIPEIKRKFPNIKIVETKDLLDSINKVLNKQVDALYDGQVVVSQIIMKNLIVGLKAIPQDVFPANKLHYFINSQKPILLSIIQKGLDNITPDEKARIISKWLNGTDKIHLTQKEKEWLAKNIVIRYAFDPDWKPIEWADKIKEQQGILRDVLYLIMQKTGINIKTVYSKNWKHILSNIKDKKADAYSTPIYDNPMLNFTNHSVLKVPYVFVTRNSDEYIDNIEDIKDKKIAVFAESYIYNLLKKDYPNLNLILFKKDEDGFKMLKDKKVDVAIFNIITAKYYLHILGFSKSLRINDKTKYNLDLRIALSKDLGEIPLSIIDKALASITKKEFNDIIYKWTNIKVQKETNWKLIIQIGGILFVIVLLMTFYNYKLNQTVKEKTKEISSLLDIFDKNVIASKTDIEGFITYVSEAFCKATEYSKEELIGKTHQIIIHPDNPKSLYENIRKVLKEGKIWKGNIKSITKSGKVVWFYTIVSPEIKDNKLIGFSSIRHDITAQKEVEELSKNLEKLVIERTKELEKQKEYLEAFFENRGVGILIVDQNRTNIKVNHKLCEIWGYEEKELIGKNALIFHISKESYKKFGEIAFSQVTEGKKIEIEYQFKKKNGEIFWAKFYGEFIGDGNVLWVINDITKEKEAQKKLENEKKLISSIMNSQESIVITTDNEQITTANKSFYKFFKVNTLEEFKQKYGVCICDTFENIENDEYLKKEMNGISWIEYVLSQPERKFKVKINSNIFSVSADSFEFEGKKFITVVLNDITELENVKKNIELLHKHTKESIEFASLLQNALLPRKEEIDKYFKDEFVFWKPKDIVGGDIYLFEKLRNENECLLMVIDCTGHGVPGAFVTMIVKAVEREIVSKIKEDKTMEVSPAWILSYFNKTIKKLLRQENQNSMSNAGFDGAIIYYDRREQILRFAGANVPLFYIDENKNLEMIKGDRYSVGYKQCDIDYEYTQHNIKVKEGMKFYITTDGYIDQIGGERELPFGKKRFKKIIEENYYLPMQKQKEIFISEIEKYKNMVENNEQNDDMTIVGFEIDKKSDIAEILEYEGILTQAIITHHIDIIEHSIKNISIISKLSTIVIELTQNMMKYSKTHELDSRDIRPAGYIKITQIGEIFLIETKNIVSIDDKLKIENILKEIKSLDEKELKQKYRELRRSGKNTHEKGGGIGFYEIAKIASNINYYFDKINNDKYYFMMQITLKPKRRI